MSKNVLNASNSCFQILSSQTVHFVSFNLITRRFEKEFPFKEALSSSISSGPNDFTCKFQLTHAMNGG